MLLFCFRNPTGSCLLLRGGYNGLTSPLAKMMKKRPVNKDVMSSWDVWKPFGFKASSEEQQIQIKFLIKVWQNWDFLFSFFHSNNKVLQLYLRFTSLTYLWHLQRLVICRTWRRLTCRWISWCLYRTDCIAVCHYRIWQRTTTCWATFPGSSAGSTALTSSLWQLTGWLSYHWVGESSSLSLRYLL